MSRPSYTQNSSRYYLRKANEEFASDVTSDMVVLDAGAGSQPYRDLFDHAHYESADFEAVDKSYAPSTYICDLASIPVEDGRFDRVVFNQVLEHIPEPSIVLSELRRVMKGDAKIICTCPLFYEEHEIPYDFYRYTQFGLKHLFQEAGFEIETIDWMEGYFGTLGYQFSSMSRCLPDKAPKGLSKREKYTLWPLVKLLKWSSQRFAQVFWKLDKSVKYTRKGYPKNYVVIARPVTR